MKILEQFPRYAARPDGAIFAIVDRYGRAMSLPRRIKPTLRRGYEYVNLGRAHQKSVAALVLQAFVGDRPDGAQVCHCNGIKSDNRLANLRWDTPSENAKDKILHGTIAAGERNGNGKLSRGDIEQIKVAASRGEPYRSIGGRLGVSSSTVFDVVSGRTWKHLGSS